MTRRILNHNQLAKNEEALEGCTSHKRQPTLAFTDKLQNLKTQASTQPRAVKTQKRGAPATFHTVANLTVKMVLKRKDLGKRTSPHTEGKQITNNTN